jgi:hypothetical protein
MQQDGDGATGEPRFSRVGAAGEDGGHARAEDNAGQLRAAQVFELLGEHVAALKIGYNQDVGLSGHRRIQVLDLCGFYAYGSIKCQWAVKDAAGDLSAVGHLAQSSSFQLSKESRIYGFHGREKSDFGFRNAKRMRDQHSVELHLRH